MIPEDPQELEGLAGEYVLGVLDAAEASEVEAALATNTELRRAVIDWEERLHPLSALASPVEPPAHVWDSIALRIAKPKPQRAWDSVVLWRRSALAAMALAASLLLYIMLAPRPAGPELVALLHGPTGEAPVWMATVGPQGLTLQAVAAHPLGADRDFELWAIAPGGKVPRSLGVIPADAKLVRGNLPGEVATGGTLAISIEPKGGSPTGQPTGPIVYVGALVTPS